jgi:hypothetical protein
LLAEVEGGYLLPDFLDYNPSKATTVKKRQANAERMRRSRQNVHAHDAAHTTDTTPERADAVRVPPTPTPFSTTSSVTPTTMYSPPGGGDVDNFVSEVVSRVALVLVGREPNVRNPEGFLVHKRKQIAHHHTATIETLREQGKQVGEVVDHILGLKAATAPDDTASAVRFGRSRAMNEDEADFAPAQFGHECLAMGYSQRWMDAAVAEYVRTFTERFPVAPESDATPPSAPTVLADWKSQMRGAL